MTGKNKVIRIFESFVLGFCKCDCKTEINIRTSSHYLKQFAHGHNRPNFGKHLGKNKNGRFLSNGYWRIYKPDYFGSYDNGTIPEHIYVYQEFHKLCMLSWGIVHHIDEKPEKEDANRIENLQGMTVANHMILHRQTRRYIKDMSGRICKICGTDSPYIRKNSSPHWLGNEKDGFVCYNCNLKMKRKSRKKLGGGYNPYV